MEIEKKSYNEPLYNQNISVKDRKQIEITGVNKIDSFDSEEFLLESILGYILIKGKDLQMTHLDTNKGIVRIHGEISDLSYIDSNGSSSAEDGIFSRLFR